MISVVKLLRQIIKNDDLRFYVKSTIDKYKIGYGNYYVHNEKLIFCEQIGGKKKIIKLDDNKEYEYHIDGVSVSKNIKNEEFEVNFLTLSEDYDGCASLIYIVNEDKIIIDSIINSKECIKCLDKTHKYKVGNVIMQIILKYSLQKFPKAKYFELSDRSIYNCYGNSLNLQMLRTITNGEPYYCKFGFRPKTKENYNIYKHNKNIFKLDPTITLKELNKYFNENKINVDSNIYANYIEKYIKTDPISIKYFIKSLMNEQYKLDEKKEMFDNYELELKPTEIKELNKINNDRLKLCKIIYSIYEKLFNHANYTRFNDNVFDLKIQ